MEFQWDQVQEIFERVCDVGPEERARALEQACNGNRVLMEEVSSLLFYHDRSEHFLENDLADAVTLRGLNGETADLEILGPYRVVEPLGVGGMGTVYKAEQLRPVQRAVALKVIHQNFQEGSFLDRFKIERQTLAMMNHPNIAHVLDAGETGDGRPFFTMEFVSGMPMTQYCDQHKLTLPQRLDLFLQVCEGVAHAHSKGIIHRDLKPSNILVATEAGKPVPKIIDFGIARVMGAPHAEASEAAVLATAVGTPAYMSPEQVFSKQVDTITDVYALGMVLYELLCGHLPFDRDQYEKTEVMKVLRLIGERTLPQPSERLRAMGEAAAESAANRGMSLKKLAAGISGDLDCIVLKALARKPQDRYQSVGELVAEIQRYRRHLPVEATPKSIGLLARKFARRNKTAVLFSAAVFLAMIALIISLAWGYRQAEARMASQENENRANATVTQILINANNRYSTGPLNLHDILMKAAAALTGESTSPRDAASFHTRFGINFGDAEYRSESVTHYREAYNIYLQILPANDEILDQAKHSYAASLVLLGGADNLSEAEVLLKEVMDYRTKKYGSKNGKTLQTERALANLYDARGRFADAQNLYRKIYRIQVDMWGEKNQDALVTLNQMANSAANAQNFRLAEELFTKMLNLSPQVYGEESTETLDAMFGLCRALVFQNKTAEGIEMGENALALSNRLLLPEHPTSLRLIRTLLTGYSQTSMGLEELQSKLENAYKLHRRALSWDDKGTLIIMNNLADIYLRKFLILDAEELKLEELAIRNRIYGKENYYVIENTVTLAQIYYEAGEWNKADEVCRYILANLEALKVKNASYRFTQILHGCVLFHVGLEREGEESIKSGSTALFQKKSLFIDDACDILFRHYKSQGQLELAKSL